MKSSSLMDGKEFWFEIPFHPDQPCSICQRVADSNSREVVEGRTALIIDDSEVVVFAIKNVEKTLVL